MSQHVYIVSMPNFKSLSGRIFAYWLPKYVCDLMRGAPKLQTKGEARQGLSTSDNNRFLKVFWHVHTLFIFPHTFGLTLISP